MIHADLNEDKAPQYEVEGRIIISKSDANRIALWIKIINKSDITLRLRIPAWEDGGFRILFLSNLNWTELRNYNLPGSVFRSEEIHPGSVYDALIFRKPDEKDLITSTDIKLKFWLTDGTNGYRMETKPLKIKSLIGVIPEDEYGRFDSSKVP
jgi:hypothetical protein